MLLIFLSCCFWKKRHLRMPVGHTGAACICFIHIPAFRCDYRKKPVSKLMKDYCFMLSFIPQILLLKAMARGELEVRENFHQLLLFNSLCPVRKLAYKSGCDSNEYSLLVGTSWIYETQPARSSFNCRFSNWQESWPKGSHGN